MVLWPGVTRPTLIPAPSDTGALRRLRGTHVLVGFRGYNKAIHVFIDEKCMWENSFLY